MQIETIKVWLCSIGSVRYRLAFQTGAKIASFCGTEIAYSTVKRSV